MIDLDLTGNPCPIPVIRAKKELEKPENSSVRVLVDNIAAVQNLEKMAKGYGYAFSYGREGEARFRVVMAKSGAAERGEEDGPKAASAAPLAGRPETDGVTVLITKDRLGSGSEELGKILIKGFIFSLTELPVPPQAVIFLNSGVRLAAEGVNTLDDLKNLAESGTKVLACGTCLNYYELTDKLAVGEVTDMFGISSLLAAPGKLIAL